MAVIHPRIAERAKEPRYTIPEGAAFIDRPTSTVRRWTLGNPRRTQRGETRRDLPLIRADGGAGDSIALSFLNLLELRFLATYRRRVPLQAIRRALDFCAQQLDVDRPLLTFDFKVHGKSLFLKFENQYAINASERGQLAWTQALEDFMESVDYDDHEHAAFRWWPLGRTQPVIVDTLLNGGLPSTALAGVRTNAIAVHRREGLDVADIAYDVGATKNEVQAALEFERLPAAA